MNMKLALAIFVHAFVYASGAEIFGYDPNDPKGPAHWASLNITGNQCGGSAQSGIDIPTSKCDVTDDYTFDVSYFR
jgi:carbonic anhydrase